MDPNDWLELSDLKDLQRSVLRWYQANGRDLPWRRTRDPYAVWISEIMLQQTTVGTVLGYFDSFLKRFPTIQALAKAPEQDVLHAWQGLGYYRRARNLQRAAQQMVRDHDGKFPADLEDLGELTGLGPYTARAVACFAFGQKVGILEANTRRLWSRVSAASGDPTRGPLEKKLWEMADRVLPATRFADFNQAVMDLGARICTPRDPKCDDCPLMNHCRARAEEEVHLYPQLPPKRAIEDVDHVSVVAWSGDRQRVIVTQRPADGPWARLWEFPRVERQPSESWSAAAKRSLLRFLPRFRLKEELLTFQHRIMHYRVTLKCFAADAAGEQLRGDLSSGDVRWMKLDELADLPWSTPQRRLLKQILHAPPPAGVRRVPKEARPDRKRAKRVSG